MHCALFIRLMDASINFNGRDVGSFLDGHTYHKIMNFIKLVYVGVL